jgi:hypothetical protein
MKNKFQENYSSIKIIIFEFKYFIDFFFIYNL